MEKHKTAKGGLRKMEGEDIDKMFGQLNQAQQKQQRLQIVETKLNVALALTAMALEHRKTAKQIFDIYSDIIHHLIEEKKGEHPITERG